MKRLFVHCDGNQISGYGHFSRCLALASIIKKFTPEVDTLFIGNYEQHALDKLNVAGMYSVLLAEGESFTESVLSKVGLKKTDFLLIDTYIAPQSFYDHLALGSYKWGVIDDFSTQNFSSAELVINFRVNASSLFQYSARCSALGPGFMPVRLEFDSIREKNETSSVKKDIEHVLICLGGNDLHGVSAQLLQVAVKAFPVATINLLLSDKRLVEKLQGEYENNNEVSIEVLRPDIECLMSDVDLLISGGGMLKYEASHCAIPNATLSQTDEQHQDTLILVQHGVTLNLGLAYDFDKDYIEEQLSVFSSSKRQRMREKQISVFPANAQLQLAKVISKQFTD